MKWIALFLLMICLPFLIQAGSLESVLDHNKRIIRMQEETNSAVRWVAINGYNDGVAYQFMLRCGWLRMVRGGYDWCNYSSKHLDLIAMSRRNGSQETRWLVDSYRMLAWYK